MLLHPAEPLRLILVSGSDSRRDFVELSIAAQLDAPLPLELIYHTIRSAATSDELESVALAIAHKFLDLEAAVGRARVAITAYGWRHVTRNVKERCGNELRSAAAEVGRDGHAAVEASIHELVLLAGGQLVVGNPRAPFPATVFWS